MTWVPGCSRQRIRHRPPAVRRWSVPAGDDRPGCAVRIGDSLLDLAAAEAAGAGARRRAVCCEPQPRRVPGAGAGRTGRRCGSGSPSCSPTPRTARRSSRCWSRCDDVRAACCRSRSPTTSTSTPPSTTPRTSARSSGPASRRCCRTGSTCRSATTAGPARWWSPAPRSCGPCGQRARRASFGAVAGAWTSRPRSASWSGSARTLGEPVPWQRLRRARLRRGAGQRLVGPGHPGLGVPAARPVPRQVLRHLGLGLGGAAGRARAAPGCRRRRRTRRCCPTCADDRARRSTCGWRSSGTASRCRRPPFADDVLDAGAAAGAHDRQRRVAAHRRPVRLRHRLRARRGQVGSFLELTWGGTEPVAGGRRQAHFPGGRRHGHHPGDAPEASR